MSHLRQVHHSEDVNLSCPVNECNATYSRVNSICSHIYRKHKEAIYTSTPSAPSIDRQEGNDSATQGTGMIFDFSIPSSISHDVDQLLNRDVHKQMKKSILFLLQLKEERLITQASVNDIVTGCSELFKYTVRHLKAGVSQTLSQSGIDLNDVDGLDSVFDELSYPFMGIETPYLQDKFISQELKCNVSSCSYI